MTITNTTVARVIIATLAIALVATPYLAFAGKGGGSTSGYSISGSVARSGLTATASGVASASAITGKADDQHVSVNWNVNGGGTWEVVRDLPVVNGAIPETRWQGSHTYTAPGVYTVRAVVHRGTVTGKELSSQVIQMSFTVTYACNDGIDNDNDRLVDAADSGCAGSMDDDESNPPVVYSIEVTFEGNGSVTPGGTVVVNELNDQTFYFAPESGYRVGRLLVDGVSTSMSAPNEYTFADVHGNHTLHVSFAPNIVYPLP